MDFTQRNRTIDLIRAITMFLMIFVNNFWTFKGCPHFLEHGGSTEDFLGFSDYIFPCFLFVMGLSIPYAIEKRYAKGYDGLSTLWHILSRTFALLVMGVFFVNAENGVSSMNSSLFQVLMIVGFFLVWNLYPKDWNRWLTGALKLAGVVLLTVLAFLFRDSHDGIFQARWWGILGLLGWAYLLCAVLYLAFRSCIWKHAVAWLVVCAISMVEAEHLLPSNSFPETLMRLVYLQPGTRVCWCLGGVITSLVALKIADWKPSTRALTAVVSILVLVMLGAVCHKFWIVSKNIETPPTLFFCLAASISLYCVLNQIIKWGGEKWFKPIAAAGTATLSCYMMPVFFQAVQMLCGMSPFLPFHGWAGVACCAVFSLVCILLTSGLCRLGIKLKI